MPSKESNNDPMWDMDAAEKREYLANICSLLYVAITRARLKVFITGYGPAGGYLIAQGHEHAVQTHKKNKVYP